MTTVREILDRKGMQVVSIDPGASALEAARLMTEHRIGSLLVMVGATVAGIVTERDILRRLVAVGKDPATTRVREILSSPVACCRPETTIEECRRVITEKRIRHLPVVDHGRLCGLVTIGDLIANELTEREITIKYLNEYMFGSAEEL